MPYKSQLKNAWAVSPTNTDIIVSFGFRMSCGHVVPTQCFDFSEAGLLLCHYIYNFAALGLNCLELRVKHLNSMYCILHVHVNRLLPKHYVPILYLSV